MTIDKHIALGDCVLFGFLAVPGLGSMIIAALISLNEMLGLPGAAQVENLSALLISLVGILGFGFGWVRVVSGNGQFLSVAMGVKAAAFLVFAVAVAQGAPVILMVIALADAVSALLLYRARLGP